MEATTRRCAPGGNAPLRERNPFPVFPGEPRIDGPIRKSAMSRRRAIVLGAVYVVMLAHAAQWLATGRTLSPVEPSEAMQTLELGRVNAGFVFFVLAILATAVFGRFFCGWGCHLVALQDLCEWLMRKAGVRPRPFRSRLLAWAPMGVALYMFVWPTFKREALLPLLGAVAPRLASLFATPPPFPGFSSALLTTGFWDTFPGPVVAVLSFAVCGFAAVYLLGAKGFCTYGCPYGAFFGAVDTVAPGRIRVTDACDGCGHCTATCTSNVRVHEEVREFGMVVDPGCMKCQDCVSVCPKGALYFGFGKPAAAKGTPRHGRIRRRWDLRRGEEIVLAVIFLGSLVAFRGLYDAVPLLMSVGVAGCVTFLAWTALRLVREPEVFLQSRALKLGGRMRRDGVLVLGVAVMVGALTLHSGFLKWHRVRAETWDRQVRIRPEALLRESPSPVPEEQLRAAERAEAHYRWADRIGHGGAGLLETPEVTMRRAWLAVVMGRLNDAATHLRRVVASGGEPASVRVDLARVLRLAGHPAEAREQLLPLIAADPADPAPHRELSLVLEREGDLEGAAAELVVLVNLAPEDRAARARLADLLDRLGRSAEADRYR